MPRAAVDKPYTAFTKGLITEATDLNYPEGSLLDMDNIDLSADGSARRRLGLEIEVNAEAIASTENVTVSEVTSHVWDSPGGQSELTFVVFAVQGKLYIRNLDTETVSAIGAISGVLANPTVITIPIDTNSFHVLHIPRGVDTPEKKLAYEASALRARLQSASGDGRLFFTSKFHRPFYLNYDPLTLDITLKAVGQSDSYPYGAVLIRDFAGIDEDISVTDRLPNISSKHAYNLLNQGWRADLIANYKAQRGGTKVYPSNAQQWILGKNAEGDFKAATLDQQDFGNSPAPKGSIIYDALNGIRDGVSLNRESDAKRFGFQRWCQEVSEDNFKIPSIFSAQYVPYLISKTVSSLPLDGTNQKVINFSGEHDVPSDTSFTSCAFLAGRVWFAGDRNIYNSNGVFFSKIIQSDKDTGMFMQENDPTSEHFMDLLDTDGGVAYIQEAGGIVKLVPFGSGMLVFARKGVWYIRGSDSGFKATDYSVDKLSEVGVLNGAAVTAVDSGVVYWTENSIMAISNPEAPVAENLSDGSIFTFYQSIGLPAKRTATGVYDSISKCVFWFYWNSAREEHTFEIDTAYNSVLKLDIRTGAFSPYSFKTRNDTAVLTVASAIPRMKPLTVYRDELVYVDDDIVQVDSEDVIYGAPTQMFKDERFLNSLKVVMLAKGGVINGIVLCDFINVLGREFTSFGDQAPASTYFDSYLVPAPETLEDIQRDKMATYVHSLFRRTERVFYENPDGSMSLDRPSGCLMSPMWDWHRTGGGHKIGRAQQAYRFKLPIVGGASQEVLDNGEEVVYTKLKVRGFGRALTLRYESEPDKDFHLLGYSVAFTANGV